MFLQVNNVLTIGSYNRNDSVYLVMVSENVTSSHRTAATTYGLGQKVTLPS